jgi:lysophospholipase L1-like esterase
VLNVLLSAAVFGSALAAIELALRWCDWADPPIFCGDPRYGYLMRPHQSVSTRGRRFRINNVGLRGEDVSARCESERRLVFVGDSNTYGGGRIADDELFVNRIARGVSEVRRQRVSSVNVAAPGWGVQNMAAFIAVNGAFEADALIWIVPSADFRRPLTSLHELAFPEERPRSRLMYVVRSWERARQTRRRPWPGSRPAPEDILSANIDALGDALRRLSGIPLLVVVLPGEHGYGRLANDVTRFKSVAQTHGASFAELAPVLQGRREERLFDDRVHLSARGHAVVTDAVIPVVVQMLSRSAPAQG